MKFLQTIIDKAKDKICPFCDVVLAPIENQMPLTFNTYKNLHKCNMCDFEYVDITSKNNSFSPFIHWKYNQYILSFYWRDIGVLGDFSMYNKTGEIFNIGLKEEFTINLDETYTDFDDKDFHNLFHNEIENLNTIEEFQSLCDKIIKQEVFK